MRRSFQISRYMSRYLVKIKTMQIALLFLSNVLLSCEDKPDFSLPYSADDFIGVEKTYDQRRKYIWILQSNIL